MDGPDAEGIAGGVDEQDEPEVPGAGLAALLAQPQIGGPAVVAVGDEGLVVAEVGGDRHEVGGVRDPPQTVVDAVFGGRGEQRLAPDGAFDDPRGPAGARPAGARPGGSVPRSPRSAVPVAVAAVGEEQRLQMGGGGAHQIGSVLDDMRHDLLVGEDDALLTGAQPQCADQPALEGGAVALFVDVERGFGVRGEHAVRLPAAQRLGGLTVAGLRGVGLRQDQPDDVVGVCRLQLAQAIGPYDHVVGG
ncbi:hypothetical protein SANTM175S_00987 [Streptomyces antimycoticus]